MINSAKIQVTLIQEVSDASARPSYKQLRSVKFIGTTGIGTTLVWGLDDGTKYSDCYNDHVKKYLALVRSNKFRNGIQIAGVLKVGNTTHSKCPAHPPPPPQAEDAGLWQRILIPVIVIVVLLLIIALILCCVYRRKRKATHIVMGEEDKSMLSHKKPVIFLEEFEEKPHFVSLQPLILPNEKPPAPGQPYEPRADSPPGSSTTVSTASEEKPLTPASPDNSRKGGYNAPPPYNA